MTIAKVDIPFYFLGLRSYVNGLTLFEEMIKTYLDWKQEHDTWIKAVEVFRINHFVRNACHLEIYQANLPQRDNVLRAAARMKIHTANSDTAHLLLMEKDEQPVLTTRQDYDRDQYILSETDDSMISDEATLCKASDLYTLMRGIVEVNYRHCCNKALEWNVSSGVSWAYLNHFICPTLDPDAESINVSFSKGSLITLPDKIFIVRHFQIMGHTSSQQAEMGFFFDLPPIK